MTDHEPMPDALAELDFRVACAMTHMGNDCGRPATWLGTIHNCNGRPIRAPLCDYARHVLEVVPYPVVCGGCGMLMRERADFVWNYEPL